MSSRSTAGAGAVPGLSRRHLLMGSAAVLGGAFLTAGLAGCAPDATAAAIEELQFWHLLTGGDGANMNTMVQKVNRQDRALHATQTILAWGTPYYTKLAMASASGRGPDVAIMHASRLPGYAPGGLLDPWDLDRLAENGITEHDFLPRLWKKGHSGGRLFSVTLDSHPIVLFYNPEILDRAGALGSDGQIVDISSPDQFVELARSVRAVTGAHGLSYGYLGDGAAMWRLFYTFYKQLGADMVLTPGHKADVDVDAAVTALSYIRRLLDDEIAVRAAGSDAATSAFLNKKTGLLLDGVWLLPTMKANGLRVDACPVPTLFDVPAAYADSHTFVLPHQRALDEGKRDASYRFVAGILRDSLIWTGGGHIPAYLPVATSAAYRAELPQAHYAGAAEYLVYDPPAWFSGSGSDFQNYFGNELQDVYLGKEKPEVGMRRFVDRLDVLLSRPNPVG